MPAGKLRERVTLQVRDPNALPNAYNEPDLDAWLDLMPDEPAEVYAFTGREFVAAQQEQADANHRVTLRTPTRVFILPVHRFVWVQRLIGGTSMTHYLDIKQVTPMLTRKGYTECMCSERFSA